MAVRQGNLGRRSITEDVLTLQGDLTGERTTALRTRCRHLDLQKLCVDVTEVTAWDEGSHALMQELLTRGVRVLGLPPHLRGRGPAASVPEPGAIAMGADADAGPFRALFEQAGVGVLLHSLEGTVRDCNTKAAALLGQHRDQLVGRSLFDVIPEHPPHHIREQFEESVESALWGMPRTTTVPVPLPYGERIVQLSLSALKVPGAPQLMSVLVDVTTAKKSEELRVQRTEEALSVSEDRFRAFIDAFPDVGFLISDAGELVDVFSGSEDTLGAPPQALAGETLHTAFPTTLADEMLTVVHQALGTGVAQQLEYALESPAGLRTFELRAAPVKSARSSPQVACISRDVTEQRTLEKQLRAAQRMEGIGRLAGGVAHDFNNLLTAILSFGKFVREALRDEDPLAEDMEEILQAARRGADLTRQLLAFSRTQAITPKALNLNDLLSNLERMLQRLLGEDIRYASALAPQLGTVMVDAGSFEQVVVNLAVNARDAMPEGGQLTVETANVTLDESYAITHEAAVPSGDYVVVAVTDTGQGMDADTRQHIFEPFFTTKEEGRGTGLGLSTCYGIVKQANGFIWVYSERGRGTTFKLYLPRVDQPAITEDARRPIGALEGHETVLVAEDNPQVRALTVRTLARLGYTVLEAADGSQALAQYQDHPSPIDLLLTDVVMPGLDGRALAEKLSAERPQMQVLYMSGYPQQAIVQQGVLAENLVLLPKPFTPEQMARTVRAILDENPERPS